MDRFKFGTVSRERLDSVHPDLVRVIELALKMSFVDFGIAQGHRSAAQQFEYYQKGRRYIGPNPVDQMSPEQIANSVRNRLWEKVGSTITTLDGYHKKGAHNYTPSRAVDIYAYVQGKPELQYHEQHLCYIAGVILTAGEFLFNMQSTCAPVRWGGNWDRDGEIITDQNFQDLVHFELDPKYSNKIEEALVR